MYSDFFVVHSTVCKSHDIVRFPRRHFDKLSKNCETLFTRDESSYQWEKEIDGLEISSYRENRGPLKFVSLATSPRSLFSPRIFLLFLFFSRKIYEGFVRTKSEKRGVQLMQNDLAFDYRIVSICPVSVPQWHVFTIERCQANFGHDHVVCRRSFDFVTLWRLIRSDCKVKIIKRSSRSFPSFREIYLLLCFLSSNFQPNVRATIIHGHRNTEFLHDDRSEKSGAEPSIESRRIRRIL